MKHLAFRAAVMSAGTLVLASCSSPSRIELPTRSPDAGTTESSIAVERPIRYYVDETGTLWDDRGRRYDGTP